MQKAAPAPSFHAQVKRTFTTITLLITLSIALLVLTACATSAGGTPSAATNATTAKSSGNAAATTKAPAATTTAAPATKDTTKAPDAAITIKDPELEKVIRKQLGKVDGNLTAADMMDLMSLRVDAKVNPVKDLDGLEYATNLNDFSYSYGTVTSLAPLAKLKTITYLTFSYAKVEQAPTTAFDVPKLERVSFIDTNVSDFTFLKNAPLNDVSFTRCGMTSLEFLRDKKNLVDVNLSDNKITDVSPLKDKTKLTRINLHKNQVADISALSTCTALESLNISYNNVSNLTPILQLPKLQELTAYEELNKKIIDRGQIQTLLGKGVTVDYHKP